MLNDEEKQAMQYFYNLRATIDESNMLFDEDIDVKCGKETIKQITIILNLIEKQSKEIEELKEDNKHQWEERCKLTFELENSTSNDKIKAKIEELDEKIKVKKEIAKNPMDRVSGRLLTDNIVELEKTKIVLQSLLEKE